MTAEPNKQEALGLLHTSLDATLRERRAALEVLLPNDRDRQQAVVMALTIMLGHYLAGTSSIGEDSYRHKVDQISEFLHSGYADFVGMARKEGPAV